MPSKSDLPFIQESVTAQILRLVPTDVALF